MSGRPLVEEPVDIIPETEILQTKSESIYLVKLAFWLTHDRDREQRYLGQASHCDASTVSCDSLSTSQYICSLAEAAILIPNTIFFIFYFYFYSWWKEF
jgi:hypothetical protein